MLQITIPAVEQWDENEQEFITSKEQTLSLEHSLVSLSKWESKWCKPFLAKDDKTTEETIDYIRCMSMTQNVDPNIFKNITNENIDIVRKYIGSPMTASWFHDEKGGKSNSEQITSELVYYWMISLNIPFECQKWHLNRLLTLIQVCNIKNKPMKKRSKRDIMSRNTALNATRRKRLNTRG